MNTQIKVTRREMTSDDRYVYSVARAARILGLKETDIEFVYVTPDNRVLVGLFNDHIYLTKREFIVAYGAERKARSNGFKVTKRLDDEHSYTVRNESKKSTYKVSCYADSIICDCPDHEISRQIFKTDKVACKHVYSVLGLLGYTSLGEYLKGNVLQIQL